MKKYQYVTIILLIGLLSLSACKRSDDEKTTEDQADKTFTVALISNNSNGLRNVEGFREGMTELGYIEGENITYVFADTFTPNDQLETVLQSMVDQKVDLIFTAGTPTGEAAYRVVKPETGIPVVFGVIADPIKSGVMENLTEPGANMTGVRLVDNQARRMQWLVEIAPETKTVLVMYNPNDTAPVSALNQLQEDVENLAINLVIRETPDEDAVQEVLDNLTDDIDAIFMLPDSVTSAKLADIVLAADERDLVVSGPSVIQVENGALYTYGFVHDDVGKQAARIADQILKGSDPGKIPVETAEFYLVINLEAAEAIGLEIPDSTLQQAEVVIRSNQ